MTGVILIYSCEKHRYTRLPKHKLPRSDYLGWKVFYVFGSPFLSKPFIFEGDTLTVKCEDSYLHLPKKVALGFNAILETFPDIEGILRCGDDLKFNEEALERFIRSPKTHYMGLCWNAAATKTMGPKYKNEFIPDYYRTHKEDFSKPTHGLPSYEAVMKMNELPKIQGASGVITYFSKKSCDLIVDQMKSIGWDITTYDTVYGYIYIIEDIANACVLSKHGIYVDEYPMWTENRKLFNEGRYMAFHTNDSKYVTKRFRPLLPMIPINRRA